MFCSLPFTASVYIEALLLAFQITCYFQLQVSYGLPNSTPVLSGFIFFYIPLG